MSYCVAGKPSGGRTDVQPSEDGPALRASGTFAADWGRDGSHSGNLRESLRRLGRTWRREDHTLNGDAIPHGYRFDRFFVDPGNGRLFRDGAPVALGPKPFDVLVALIERRGEVVSKERLQDLVWPGTAVSESTLFAAVSRVRTALGEPSRHPRYIRTTPKRGYTFVAPVTGSLQRKRN